MHYLLPFHQTLVSCGTTQAQTGLFFSLMFDNFRRGHASSRIISDKFYYLSTLYISDGFSKITCTRNLAGKKKKKISNWCRRCLTNYTKPISHSKTVIDLNRNV